jgi:hypothetical protein
MQKYYFWLKPHEVIFLKMRCYNSIRSVNSVVLVSQMLSSFAFLMTSLTDKELRAVVNLALGWIVRTQRLLYFFIYFIVYHFLC